MNQDDNISVYKKIIKDQRYTELVKKRNAFQILTTVLTLTSFYVFILIAAFYPAFLAQPASQGAVTTVGIILGVGLMIALWILTGVYIYRANHDFDVINDDLIRDYRKEYQ